MIKIIDNIVSAGLQQAIKDSILHGDFPWFLYPSSVDEPPCPLDSFPDSNTREGPQLVHVLYEHVMGGVNSHYWQEVVPVIEEINKLFGIQTVPLRVKVNANWPSSDGTTYRTPHVDHVDPNLLNCIYYVNDSDGDTVFFDSTITIVDRVQPKQGRLVCFNSGQIHSAASPQTTKIRSVINFLFDIKGAEIDRLFQ